MGLFNECKDGSVPHILSRRKAAKSSSARPVVVNVLLPGAL